MLIISFLVFSCLAVPACYGDCSLLDRDSLRSFNLSASAAPPLNWSLWVDCCSWEGVGCDDNSGRVTTLSLPFRGLTGAISPSLVNLTRLSRLNLSHNLLSGSLPDGFFASCNSLQAVDFSCNLLSEGISETDKLPAGIRMLNLSNNHFHGTIRSSFLEPALNLEMFDVSYNYFSGSIPSSICSFSSSIWKLDFSSNDFVGPIPPGLSHCRNLQSLRAGFNDLLGEIPHDVYGLLKLQELYMPGNNLSGQMDERTADLTSLKIIALYNNNLTGTIPRNIGRLHSLEHLLLHLNRLTGTIPPSLTHCTRLMSLNLWGNYLEGELSAFDFSRFNQLTTISLGLNSFTGALPKSLFLCRMLLGIQLSHNNLSGEIPPEIVALHSLSFLSLSDNNLTNIAKAFTILARCKNLNILGLAENFYDEEMPHQAGHIPPRGFRNLQILRLSGCRLTGHFPLWLSKLVNLAVIALENNRITGPIPGSIGVLPYLFYLDLSYNRITGRLPLELTRLRALQATPNKQNVRFILPLLSANRSSYLQVKKLVNIPLMLSLGNNNMSGTIPAEIGNLKSLTKLFLDHNEFTGSIPGTISNLRNLEKLDLAVNRLIGEIPPLLQNLHFLSSFNVSFNNLGGMIPTGGQFDTFPSSCFQGNPRLCGKPLLQGSPCQGNHDRDDRPRIGRGSYEEIINYNCFEIGYAICFILSASLVFRFLSFETGN